MSETRLVRRDELLQGDKCGGVRGRQPNGCFLDEAIYAGLRPADVLVYVKRSQGRENRPYQKRSTVAAKSATFCKSRHITAYPINIFGFASAHPFKQQERKKQNDST